MHCRVVVTDWGGEIADAKGRVLIDRALTEVGASVAWVPRGCCTEEQVLEVARHADGIMVEWAPMTRRVIQQLERCRIIARFGTGYDNIDFVAAAEHGIYVTNVPDYCMDEVSSHAMALLLAVARRITELDRWVKGGNWHVLEVGRPIWRTQGRTLGIVGLGRIGRALVPKARGFGFRLLVSDPHLERPLVQSYGADQVSLDELLTRSDYVSLHCPLTEETRHLIGERELHLMKPTAILVNTARGAVIDNTALHRALVGGWIAGAGLDVLEQEPPDDIMPLVTLPNVVVSPHAAFYSEESLLDVQQRAAEEVARVLAGEAPLHPVNSVAMPR